MAEDSFPTLLKSFIVITLFALALVIILTDFAGNYSHTDASVVTERIGAESINSTLITIQGNASGWQETFEHIGEGNIFSDILDVLGLLSVGMFNLVKSMGTFILLPFALFSNILVNVLGIPVIVMNIINVLIILAIVFGIWSLVKRGI
jgi:hypothetical protein